MQRLYQEDEHKPARVDARYIHTRPMKGPNIGSMRYESPWRGQCLLFRAVTCLIEQLPCRVPRCNEPISISASGLRFGIISHDPAASMRM